MFCTDRRNNSVMVLAIVGLMASKHMLNNMYIFPPMLTFLFSFLNSAFIGRKKQICLIWFI